MSDNASVFFGEDFFEDHAGRLIHSTDTALIELVANSWDAGASLVEVSWPSDTGDVVSITDDGTGMSLSEFNRCWRTLSYNRIRHQGNQVVFPDGQKRKRRAYGCNGKGRHSMFCFSDQYIVETWRDGRCHTFRVARSSGERPWEISEESSSGKAGHGTRIHAVASRGLKDTEQVRHLLGSKFIADPEFRVLVNGREVAFEELVRGTPREPVRVPGHGDVQIIKIQAEKGRTTKHHGLAWWVNNRLVGDPDWNTLNGPLLDGRKALAKSLTYIVLADILEPQHDIVADWSEFVPNKRTRAAHEAVSGFVRASIQGELKGERRQRKRRILEMNRPIIRRLSQVSQNVVASFLDEVQLHCPSITDQDLENTASLLIRLEQTRSGYDLLNKLSETQPEDLDAWNDLIERLSVAGARQILEELEWRLELIRELEKLVEDAEADELHELQPLFEKGLWIFGPEYEAVDFRSNKWLSTVIKDFFGEAVIENPRIRPDFVALPDASLGAYSCNAYDERGEVSGYAKTAIVELKRGGFELTGEELYQAEKYAHAIRRSGKVSDATQIVCFVLGATQRDDARDEKTVGNIRIIPRNYSVVLKQAHARTFNLHEQIKAMPNVAEADAEWQEVTAQGDWLEAANAPEAHERGRG